MRLTLTRARAALLVAIGVLSVLIIVLIVVFFRLLTPAGPRVAGSPIEGIEWVRSMYGFGPTADEQLLSPSSVAVAPDGSIYATDPIRARVMVFGSDGAFRRLLHTGGGGVGKGQFIRPEAIAVDANGEVYIADSRAKKIIVFNSQGRFLREWPVDQQARGVSVSAGKVYVLDIGKVIIFDTQGKRLSQFGQRGPGPGMIDAYQGIVARGGIVYIADSYNKRIQAFDERGKLKWVLPKGIASREGPAGSITSSSTAGDGSGSGKNKDHSWQLPQDLTFDGAGRLIVVDAFTFELDVVDPYSGKVLDSYGEFGRADGQFFYPTSIAYDKTRDWFVVADTQNNRVQIVRVPGSGASVGSMGWRAASSPYRYLLIPAVLLVLTAVAAWLLARRLRKGASSSSVEVDAYENEED